MKASEIGVVDKQYSTISHLGHLLHPGDTVMGDDDENRIIFKKISIVESLDSICRTVMSVIQV